jgi:DNA-binding protein YbaB
MTHLAPDDHVRLERLRATDTTGVYAGDEPTTGTSPDGSVTVTIDPLLRVVAVQVHAAEGLRTDESLNEALSGAYRDALARRVTPSSPDPQPGTPRPVARRVRRVSARATPERLERHQVRYRPQPSAGRARSVTGSSDNQCVTVTLAPSASRGVVTADPGWLAQTTGPRLSGALTEAFLDAHSRRSDPS